MAVFEQGVFLTQRVELRRVRATAAAVGTGVIELAPPKGFDSLHVTQISASVSGDAPPSSPVSIDVDVGVERFCSCLEDGAGGWVGVPSAGGFAVGKLVVQRDGLEARQRVQLAAFPAGGRTALRCRCSSAAPTTVDIVIFAVATRNRR